jgi:phage shock protein PspC (stress-responsive transcriptional regulator)
VAGGLGQYLGVDSTVLRIGFVIASLVFLGGFGGPILYIIAWVLVPEEGKDSPVNRATFSGRPWQDWDRSARSWALVLGALALALIWSFGIWPWWHWRVLPFWLAALGVGLWLLARHREGGWASAPRPSAQPPSAQPPWDQPAGPGAGPGPGSGPGGGSGPSASGPDSSGPLAADLSSPVEGTSSSSPTDAAASVTTITAPVTGSEPVASPVGTEAATGAAVAASTGQMGANVGATSTPGSSVSTDNTPPPRPLSPPASQPKVGPLPALADASSRPVDPSEADWAVAQSAAADWAASQLALAGMPSGSGSGNPAATAAVGPPTTRAPLPAVAARSLRRAVRVLLALVTALVLLAVVAVVGVVLGTGSSLSGGAGVSSFSPSTLGDVQSNYHLGAGKLVLDLSSVKFPAAGKAVDVTVGLGNLIVDVPKDAVVTVDARSGIGQVDVFGQTGSDIETTNYGTATPTSGAPHLDLDAHVGVGRMQVSRG